MTDTYLIIKTVSDSMDAGTLLMTQIALAMASFSTGASILLLSDYIKRHKWQYKKKKKEFTSEEQEKLDRARKFTSTVKK